MIEKYGYPITLLVDGTVGLVGLALLPWMAKPKAPALSADAATASVTPAPQ